MLSQDCSLSEILQEIDQQNSQDQLTLSQQFLLEKKNIETQKNLLNTEKVEISKEISNIAAQTNFTYALVKRALEECSDEASDLKALKKIITIGGDALKLLFNVGGLLAAYQFGQAEAFGLLIQEISYLQFGSYDDLTNSVLEEALYWSPSDPIPQQNIGQFAEEALIKAFFCEAKSLTWIIPLLIVRPNLIELKNPIDGKSIFDQAFESADREVCLWLSDHQKYPFMLAALEGKLTLCRKLLLEGAVSNAEQWMTVRAAARYGNISLIQLLQSTGWDIANKDNLALKTAIEFQQVSLIRYLLSLESVYQAVVSNQIELEEHLKKSGLAESIEVLRLGWLGRPTIDCLNFIREKMQDGLGNWGAWKKVFHERLEKIRNKEFSPGRERSPFVIQSSTEPSKSLFCDNAFFLEKLHQKKSQILTDLQAILDCINVTVQDHLKIPLLAGFPRFASFNFEQKKQMGIFKEWVLPITRLQEKILSKLPESVKEALQQKQGFLEVEYEEPLNASVASTKGSCFYFRYTFNLYYHNNQSEILPVGRWNLFSEKIAPEAHAGIDDLVDYFYHCPYDSKEKFERSRNILRFMMVNGESEAVQLIFGLWYQWVALLGLNNIAQEYFVENTTSLLPLYKNHRQKNCALTPETEILTDQKGILPEY